MDVTDRRTDGWTAIIVILHSMRTEYLSVREKYMGLKIHVI